MNYICIQIKCVINIIIILSDNKILLSNRHNSCYKLIKMHIIYYYVEYIWVNFKLYYVLITR